MSETTPPPLPDLAAWMETPEYQAMMAQLHAQLAAQLAALVAALNAGALALTLPKPPDPVPPDPLPVIDPAILILPGPPELLLPPELSGLPYLPDTGAPEAKGTISPAWQPVAIDDLLPLSPVADTWLFPEHEALEWRAIGMAAVEAAPGWGAIAPERHGDAGEGAATF